jgi:uncharacterized protein YuzE
VKLHYYPETDSLYIDVSDKTSVDTREVAPGVVLDFDAAGNLVGIDIDHASEIVALSRLEAEDLEDVRDMLESEGEPTRPLSEYLAEREQARV